MNVAERTGELPWALSVYEQWSVVAFFKFPLGLTESCGKSSSAVLLSVLIKDKARRRKGNR